MIKNSLYELYPENADIIRLGDHCIWCWECYSLAKVYCDSTEIDGWHDLDPMLVNIFKEYSFLLIAKLHDPSKIGRHDCHSIKYVVEQMDDNQALQDECQKFLDENKQLIDSVCEARQKTIAHNDVKTGRTKNKRFGKFPEGSEANYFDGLRKLLDKIYKQAGMDCFGDWPDFVENDARDLVKILTRVKNGTATE